MNVLFWSRGPFARQATLDALADVPGVSVQMVETLEDVVREAPDAELLVTGDVPAPEARQVLQAATQIGSRTRGLHFISAGRDGFEEAGIPDTLEVTGPLGANAAAVAEHAMALTLSIGRQMIAVSRNTEAKVWDRSLVTKLRSLEGQQVLIVGLGHVGREYARRAKAFGARTVGLQRERRADDSVDELAMLAELDARLPDADVVLISLALTAETAGLFDARRFGLMKPTALLINVARGGLVDTDALADALASGRLAGAGLDVTEPEPLPGDHPLWEAPGALISSHFAGGGSPASMRRIGQSVADRARALQGVHDHV